MKTEDFWINKKVLVTGGTAGLGKALHLELNKQGAKTARVARSGDQSVIRGDVSNKNQVHRIFAEAISQLGSVDVLINNASTLGPTPLKLLMDTECEDFEDVLQTNLLGPFRLIKLATSQMILRQSGVIVNISSDAAVSAYPRWGSYGISKAALDHMSRIFQIELELTGVKFLALDPGDMNTELHLSAVPDADRSTLHDPADSAQLILQQIANQQFLPIRRGIR